MEKPAKQRSLSFHIARGSVWAVVARWTMRGLGLISTIVLARLLTPTDFGVVAIAMIVVGLLEIFGLAGQYLAIIRHSEPTPEHYNTAWTISVLLGLFLGSLIWLSAPVAVLYFHESRAESVLHVVAFRTMIAGFENVGAVVNFRRQFRFRALSAYTAGPSFISFFITLFSALILRNYWALVIGIMCQQVITVALSYILEPYRPSFSLAKISEIRSFSLWTLARNLGFYFNAEIDKLAVGGFLGTPTMGRYEVATDVATAPTAEINAPMIATLFPIMVKVQNDHAKRRELYLRVLYWSALICASTSVGVALVTNDMVDVVLGPQWGGAKPLFPWLALAYGLLGVSSSVYSAFDVIGQPHKSAKLQWTRFAVLFVCVIPVVYISRSAEDVAIVRFVVTLLITPTLFLALARALGVTVQDIVQTLWRPLAASLVMAAAVLCANSLVPVIGATRLALDVSLGAATYIVTLMILWAMIGKPEGPERMAWAYVQPYLTGRAVHLTRL